MPTINKDGPCHFTTTVTRNRLSVFRTDALKTVACAALDEARHSGGFALFAYVSLVDHHSGALPVFSESFFMEKVNYIHLIPQRGTGQDWWRGRKSTAGRARGAGRGGW